MRRPGIPTDEAIGGAMLAALAGVVWFFNPLLLVGSIEAWGALMLAVGAVLFTRRHFKRTAAFRALLDEHAS